MGDLNLSTVEDDLRQLLTQPQVGSASIAKEILRMISARRSSQYALQLLESIELATDVVFQTLPADQGHFGVPYFDHVLRGLRRSLPPYVRIALSSGQRPTTIPNSVAGIVLVEMRRLTL